MIIGLTGAARSGKDTAAAYIEKTYGVPSLSLADPLKKAVMAMFGITEEMAYGYNNYDREKIVEPWGISVREMLQTMGTEVGRETFKQDFWTRRADETLRTDPMYKEGFVITDIRFDDEADWLLAHGGVLTQLIRIAGTDSLCRPHKSENGVSFDKITCTIDNGGTLDDLHAQLDNFIKGNSSE